MIEEQIRVVVSALEPEKGPITLRLAEPEPPDPGVKLKVGLDPDTKIKLRIKEPIKVYLKIRSTLGGDYMIFDHPLYDIAILPGKNKIATFVRDDAQIDPYPSQSKFFNFLRYRGIILAVYDFLKDEAPDMMSVLDYENSIEDLYTEPSDEDATEYGEVPHEDKKGGIDPAWQPYGLVYRI